MSQMSTTRPRVIVIADDPDIHSVIELILGDAEYEFTCCQTGEAGLEALRRQPPDLVLLDIMLTQPTEGLQIACQMRQDERWKNIPIIFISAVGQTQGAAYAREVCPIPLDTITFLEKPLNAATLRAAVRRALQRDGGR